MKPSRSEFLDIRGTRYHIRRWGDPDAPLLVMCHGWMDMSATYQFVVDALREEWSIVAPDWRGYGQSEWRNEAYSIYDDMGALDAILDHYSPDAPVRLVGHSLGGATTSLYAGARPERIAVHINIEGFGPIDIPLEDAPQRVAKWLDGQREGGVHRTYPDRAALAERLRKANPRLTEERAAFLAEHFGQLREDGQIELAADPWRRAPSLWPSFPVHDLLQTFLRRIEAPVLWIRADDSSYMQHVFTDDSAFQKRFECLVNGRDELVTDAGHNIQHDQPEVLAKLIESFLAEH